MLAARYLKILLRDPGQRFARERLFELRRARDRGLDKLADELRAMVGPDRRGAAASALLGHVEAARQRPAEAEAAFRAAMQLAPKSPAPLRALAELARGQDRLPEARALLETALGLVKGTELGMLLQELADMALAQQDFDAARGYFDRVAVRGKGSIHARTAMAQALGAHGEHARAVAEYQRVLRSLHGDTRVLAPVLVELARAQSAAGDPGAAIETLDRAEAAAGARPGLRHEIRELLVAAHRQAGSLATYAEALVERGGDGFAMQALIGRLSEELGQPDAAVAAYRRALKRRARDEDTHLRLIRILSRQGDAAELVAAHRALVKAAPREPRHVLALAQLLMESARRPEALKQLAAGARRFRRDVGYHRGAYALYERWTEVALATRALRTLVRLEPREPSHLVVLGEHLQSHGDSQGARVSWKRIVQVDRDRARAHATLGGVYLEHDLIVEALAAYTEAVKRRPQALAYVRGLAEALERAHRGVQAVEQWQRVLELSGDDRSLRREARRHIVDIWHGRGELESKLSHFERAFGWSARRGVIPVDNPDLEAGRFLAEGYARLAKRRRRGRTAGDQRYARAADAVLARVVELSPQDVETLLALERSLAGRGDIAGAIDVLKRLAQADPAGTKDYLARMAKHALSLYRDTDAVEYARRAVELNPSDAIAHRRLGDLYRGRQSTADAIRSYERAVELEPRLFAVHFDLAELYLAAGEPQRADRLLRIVIRTAPDGELVMRAARSAIQLGVAHHGLSSLEQELLPLALGHHHRPVFRRALVELYDAHARPLVYRSRGDGLAAVAARQALVDIGRRAVKPLLEALADEDPAQRRVAIDILGYLGNSHAAAPLLRAAEQAGPMEVRLRALRAAAAVATPALVGRLAELASGSQRRLRAAATWGLARAGGQAAATELRRLLTSSTPTVRGYAILGLGFIGGHGGDALARRLLESDRSGFVRGCAALTLGLLRSESDVARLGSALRVRTGPEAVAAASALGFIPSQRAIEVLASAVFVPDAQLRVAALTALSRSLSEATAPTVARLPAPRPRAQLRWLTDRLVVGGHGSLPSPLPRGLLGAMSGAGSAALSGPVESVRAVLSVLESPQLSPSLRGELVAVLVAPLSELATHPEPAIRARALRALSGADAPQLPDAVLAGLRDDVGEVVQAALSSIADGATPHSGPVLERLRELAETAPSWSQRRAAVRILARVVATDADARTVLAGRLLDDPYAFVREEAATALAHAGHSAAVEPLRSAVLRDKSPHVRASAARALSAVDPAAARKLSSDGSLDADLRALLSSAN